jgi:hypothetical protein
MESVVEKFGKIDVLVNNAGLQVISPIIDFDTNKWKQIFDVQVNGSFYTTRAAMNQMIKIHHEEKNVGIVTPLHFNAQLTELDKNFKDYLSSSNLTSYISKSSLAPELNHLETNFVNAAIFSEKDTMKSVSSCITVGRVIPGGTGSFDLLLDTEKLEQSEYNVNDTYGRISFAPLQEEPIILLRVRRKAR